jgi:hypothetical protein
MEQSTSENILISDIEKLREEVAMLNEKMKTFETILLKLSVTAERTDSHIDFITNTYETFKAPLYYVKNTVDKLVGVGYTKINTLKSE